MTGWVTFSQVCPNCGEVFGWNDVITGNLSEGLTKYMWHHKDCNNPTDVDDDHDSTTKI